MLSAALPPATCRAALQVRIVQKLTLPPLEQRLACIQGAGYNTFLLQNADVFLDMLTDSGAWRCAGGAAAAHGTRDLQCAADSSGSAC